MKKNQFIFLCLIVFLAIPAIVNVDVVVTSLFFCLLAMLPIGYSIIIEKNIFEPIALTSFMYIAAIPIYFLFTDFFIDNIMFSRLNNDSLESGLIWGYLGFACFLLGYYIVFFKNRVPYRFIFLQTRRDFYIYCAKFIGIIALSGQVLLLIKHGGVASAFIESESTGEVSTYGQIIHHFSSLRFSYILIYLVLRLNIRKFVLDVLFYMILSLQLLEIIGMGSKSSIISLAVTFVLVLTFTKYKFSVKQLAISAVMIFIVQFSFTIIENYRQFMLQEQEQSFEKQVGGFIQAFEEIGITREENKNSEDIFNRLALIASFSSVLQVTNGIPPYENAVDSFLIPIYTITPRSFFPDKVQFFGSAELASQYFGWKFGGISVSLLGSFYWAWGYIGILLGMMCMGAVFAYIFGNAKNNILFQALFVPATLLLMDTGKTFQEISFELIRIAIIFIIIKKTYPFYYRNFLRKNL